jgi:excisionase family DNA binding protein
MEVNTDNHISVDEARRRLGITRQRVHRLLQEGKLKGVRHEIGGRATWTVDADDVEARKEEGRPEAA